MITQYSLHWHVAFLKQFFTRKKRVQTLLGKSGIEVVVKGGIGNQLFRISQAIEMSINTSRPIKFNTNAFTHDKWRRASALGPLGIPINTWLQFQNFENEIKFSNETGVNFSSPSKIIVEEFHHVPISIPDAPFIIDGYFQSPKYFEINSIAIKNFLKSKFNEINFEAEVPAHLILHIRGGDYLNQAVAKVMNLNRETFLRDAFFYLGSPKIIELVSDDKKYAEELIRRSFPKIEIVWAGTSDLFHDFIRIMSAQQIVISNSTFSWWAAYLSDSRVILSPKQWFSDEVMEKTRTEDLFPTEWVLI